MKLGKLVMIVRGATHEKLNNGYTCNNMCYWVETCEPIDILKIPMKVKTCCSCYFDVL
jgi:hypothetical protein